MKNSIKNVLIMANYSNQTGFAWNNIYKLFQSLAANLRLKNVTPYISFSEVKKPVSEIAFQDFEEIFCLQPKPRNLGELLELRNVIRKYKIDAIYLTDQSHYSVLYALYRLWGVKKIVNHNRISVAAPNDLPPEAPAKAVLKYLISRLPAINCDRIYAVSEFVKRRLVNNAKVPHSKVRVILNGIDTEVFKPNSMKENLGVMRIYAGGRSSKYKGFQDLFKAADLLVNQRNITNFVIDYAGDGPDRPYLEAIVEEAKISSWVNFLGEVRDTSKLQGDADIIVVPSAWGDACPSAISEALASGKPLVATMAGGIPELIGSQENAILIPHSDASALANALQRLLEDKKLVEQLSASARRRATEALDIKRYHREVRDSIFEDLKI